jgi:hypothetical protein
MEVETTKQKGIIRRKKLCRPKPKEQEGMPQHQHYPLAKYREDENPKCNEDQLKNIA